MVRRAPASGTALYSPRASGVERFPVGSTRGEPRPRSGLGPGMAPLVADSLLNFTSGSVRTNTLRVTAETASQPILLLTGSDMESQNEIDLVDRYAGATYTLTGQWQHGRQGGDVVRLTDNRQVSLLCSCGPREYCDICERVGQSQDERWTRRQELEALQ